MNEYQRGADNLNVYRSRGDSIRAPLIEEVVKTVATTQPPDPKLHKYISFGKSGLRLVAAMILATGNLLWAGILFYIAEILGIFEEMV